MSTNKLVLRSADEFMADYQPVYQPVYPLFLGKSQQYSEFVGQHTMRRLEAVGDIRARHITPKDTDIKQIAVKEGSKVFKKYFLANQFVQSELQDREQNEDVIRQVLDEHNKQADDLLFLGEGTSASTMVNNGLFWSNDPNYVLKNSDEIANAPDTQNEMYDNMVSDIISARDLPGRKIIMVYGTTAVAKLDSLVPSQVKSVRSLLNEVLAPNESLFSIPSGVGLGSVNGWLVVNMDYVKLHYTTLPKLNDQGVNAEKMHSWHNFIMGSMMVDVLAYNAIRRQPVTFEA